jgi:predicted nuclease of predicted toxin-antitoxin system
MMFTTCSTAGADHEAVLALNRAQGRVLVTEDKDFGEQAIRYRKSVPGLILLCFATERRQ